MIDPYDTSTQDIFPMHTFQYNVELIINNRIRTMAFAFLGKDIKETEQLCKNFIHENYGKDAWYRIKSTKQLN